MDHAYLLSFSVSGGLFLLLAAAMLALYAKHLTLRATLLRRLSGEALAATTAAHGSGEIALRRRGDAPWFMRFLPALPDTEHLARFTAEMRRALSVLALTVTTAVAALLYGFLGIHLFLGLAAGLLLSGLIWHVWAKIRMNRRLFSIAEAVPEALDMIVRSLKVGLPVTTAIKLVGQELTGPLAEEFAETSRQISYGQDQIRALREMAERCRNQNLRFFAAAVALQTSTGGNLAEVLERLCAIARGRQQLLRKVRSITAEARWSGRFLTCFPLLATAMLLAVNPRYFDDIQDKDFFWPMIAGVAFLLLLNMLFMRWLVRIE